MPEEKRDHILKLQGEELYAYMKEHFPEFHEEFNVVMEIHVRLREKKSLETITQQVWKRTIENRLNHSAKKVVSNLREEILKQLLSGL